MSAASAPVKLSAGEILNSTVELLRLAPHRPAIALLIQAGGGIVVDGGLAGADAAAPLNFILSFAGIALQYWILKSLLIDLGYPLPRGPRFPAFFLMGILATLGILAGLVLLVVPGIVLTVRWWISGPLLIASERRASAALADSWRATAGHFRPIFLAAAAIYGAAMLGAVGGGIVEATGGEPIVGTALLNVTLIGGLIVGWHATVAVYGRLRPQTETLTEIFE